MNKEQIKEFIEKRKVHTFGDLVFKKRPVTGGVQAVMEFANGHKISVVGGGQGLYGDGINTFEIWRSCDEDVKGRLTKEEVSIQMLELLSMSKDVPIVGFK